MKGIYEFTCTHQIAWLECALRPEDKTLWPVRPILVLGLLGFTWIDQDTTDHRPHNGYHTC